VKSKEQGTAGALKIQSSVQQRLAFPYMTIIGAGQTNVCFLLDTSNGPFLTGNRGQTERFPRAGGPPFPLVLLTHNTAGAPLFALFAKGGIPHRPAHPDPVRAQRSKAR